MIPRRRGDGWRTATDGVGALAGGVDGEVTGGGRAVVDGVGAVNWVNDSALAR
jgi:hypothetical protein